MQWLVTGLVYMALMCVLTMLIANLRTGGRYGGHAVMLCDTVLGLSPSEISDSNVADECAAADAVVGVSPYAGVTPYSTVLEIILFVGTMCFAALEMYDIWAWFCLEWRFYKSCRGDEHGTPDDVESTKGSSANVRETEQVLLEQRRSKEGKDPKVGIVQFLGFVLLEVAWVYFGWALRIFGRLVKLKERSPLSQQRMDVVSSLFLWGFTFVIIFHFILFVAGVVEPWDNYTPNVELSVAALLGWPHLLNYGLGFKELGYLIITIGEMLVKDVLRFLIIFFVLSVAYAQAFYIIQMEASMPSTMPAYGETIKQLLPQWLCLLLSLADAAVPAGLFRSTKEATGRQHAPSAALGSHGLPCGASCWATSIMCECLLPQQRRRRRCCNGAAGIFMSCIWLHVSGQSTDRIMLCAAD